MATEAGLRTVIVPLEARLRASELLAKHVVMPKQKDDDKDVVASPEILRVAHMLETDERYTDADLRDALMVVAKDI